MKCAILLAMLMVAGCSSSESHRNQEIPKSDMASSDIGTDINDPKDGVGSDVGEDPDFRSDGCGAVGAYTPGTTTAEITHDGVSRTFRVHVPPGYESDHASPLVFMFHGGGGSGRQFQMNSSRMDVVADRENFITVYPDGTGMIRTWNGGGCCGAGVRNNVDDVGFVAALLDHLEANICLDRRKVFASGMSNGGIMSYRLACDLSERIAAVAPVAGTDMTLSCSPTRQIPVMQIHGTADGHVPWEGGEGCGLAGVSFTSIPDTMEGWKIRNGCGESVSSYFAEGNGTCEVFEGCSSAKVVLCSIEGGGHSWPGGEPGVGVINCPENGPQSQSFSASEAAWRFFADVTRELL